MVALLGISPPEQARLHRDLHRGRSAALPGAVRASLGLGTTSADIAQLVEALETIATTGPRWTYHTSPDGTDCRPNPDPRPRPLLPFDLA